MADAVVPQGSGHLFGERFEKRRRLLPEVVAQVELLEARADEIPGVKDAGNLHDIDDGIPRGDGFRAHMVEALLHCRRHQLIHNTGDFLPELPTRSTSILH